MRNLRQKRAEGLNKMGENGIAERGAVDGDLPCKTHTYMMWEELGKSAEEGEGARLVGDGGGLGILGAGTR